MRKENIFFDAVSHIREELIEDALDHAFRKKVTPWRRYAALAACLALMVTVGFAALRLGVAGGGSDSAADMIVNGSTSMSGAIVLPGAADKGAAPESVIEESAAESSDSSGSPTEAEGLTFAATVLQVEDTRILVEPLEGEEILSSSDCFMVSITDVEDLPQLKEGYEIVITFDGFIRESYPAQITAAQIKPLLRELGKD